MAGPGRGKRVREREECEEQRGIACVRDGSDYEHGAIPFECLLVYEALEGF